MKTFEERKKKFEDLKNTINFNNNIVILGLGGVGTLLVYILSKILINPKIIVLDKNKLMFDKIKNLKVRKIIGNVNSKNLKKIFIDELKLQSNDIIIDSSFEIDTLDMFILCHQYGISFINSAVEDWNDSKINYDTYAQRIYQIEIQNLNFNSKNTNFIIGLGCNPGNVNLWIIYALRIINKKFFKFNEKKDNHLSHLMELRTIHISEKDSQITNNPKRFNEYLNTWASNKNSWYDEAFSYVEVSWGSHEKNIYDNMIESDHNQMIINQEGCNYFARTYVPSTPRMLGMMIRHEECYTISKYLSIKDKYTPSCYYIYHPNDSSKASIYEVIERNYKYQDNHRLMTNDIIDGLDEVGATLFFNNGMVFWVGSILSIKESRDLFDNQLNQYVNATLLQVVAGYLGGIIYLIKLINNNQKLGLILPEEIPLNDYLNISKIFLGIFGIFKVNWNSKNPNDKWQFDEFLVDL